MDGVRGMDMSEMMENQSRVAQLEAENEDLRSSIRRLADEANAYKAMVWSLGAEVYPGDQLPSDQYRDGNGDIVTISASRIVPEDGRISAIYGTDVPECPTPTPEPEKAKPDAAFPGLIKTGRFWLTPDDAQRQAQPQGGQKR